MLLKRALRSALVLLAALSLFSLPAREARAVITYQGQSAIAESTVTSINPAYPASVAAGDLLVMIIGMKPSTANSGSVATPESWTLITSATGQGGYGGTLGADTGNTNVFAYYKIAEGNETGSLRVRLTTNSVSWARIHRITNATMDWSVAGTTGSDATAGAAVSILMAADPGVATGDVILGAMVIPTDVNTPGDKFTNYGFSQSGVVFGASTEIVEAGSNLGTDIGGFAFHATVASGTSAGSPTLTATASGTTTNVRGPGIFIRVRATGTVTYQSAGAINYVDATVAITVCPAHPAAVADGDLLVTIIGMKPSAANSGSVTTPSGWTAVPNGSLTGAGGYGATLGADTGNTNVFSYYRLAKGNEASERCFEIANSNITWAQMYRYSSTNQGWSVAGSTGQDTSASATPSIPTTSNPGVTVNDHILGAMVHPTDALGAGAIAYPGGTPGFSQTSATFAGVTEINEIDISTNNDIGGFVIRSNVTAGTGTANPVISATVTGTNTNIRGPGVFIRIRETQPAFTQAAFRFYADGTESGSTDLANQDTNITLDATPGTTNLQLRLRIQETNAASGAATDDYRLQYSKNGAAYTNVTNLSANVRGFNSSMAEGDATTKRLTGGTGAFLAGEVSEVGEAVNHRITYSKHTEYLYTLTLVPADFVLSSNTLDFRVLRNGVVMTYSVTPRITVVKPVAPSRFNAVDTGGNVATGPIKTKIAATNFPTLDIVALNVGGTVEAGFFGNVKVEVYDGLPGGTPDVTTKCSPSWTLIPSTPTSYTVTLIAGVGTIANVNVANAYKNARIRIAYPATGSEFRVGCSSDNFAIRPSSLVTPAAFDDDWATASSTSARALDNVSAAGGSVHKAGQPFRITATAQNSAAATTTNYNGAPSAISVTRVLPTALECAGCTAGTVNPGTWANSAGGVADTIDATYNQAGSITTVLQDQSWAAVDASDGSTNADRFFESAPFTVGRFVPDHFRVSAASTPLFRTYGTTDASCQTPPAGNKRVFTYIGQTFGYTAVVPVTTFTAMSADGTTVTTNYTASLLKTAGISATQTYSPAVGVLARTINAPVIATGTLGSGTGTVTSNSSDTFSYVRDNSNPQNPFTAAISLDVSVSDASEAGASQGTITTTFTSIPFPSPIGFDMGGLFRYGRLRLQNAAGSGLADLPVPMTTQYWDGSKFVTNADDHCTSLASNTNVTLSPYTGGVSGTNLGAPGHISLTGGAVKSGVGFVKIIKPSSLAAKGTATPEVNLTGETKTYLQGNWSGSPTYTANPNARAAFGVFGAQPRNFIFNRENH